ncbi:tyrosine-type recombinase/integrase [Thermosediminibacter oceani]|uniref:Integrase family protein n=1 Tax=Thermosediminibacter oceani (strain ATCC BAA-1034 / DSM 16646 / JW/IW-1228P) TaxID=555079 RepID=D9S3S7_THEOJ|nr:tyrosine-type recombinase/integrase [Thermosediminibacter oceani]ADL08054.1 integrase family protein [Thermosediminibacter oceani DSM 16646]
MTDIEFQIENFLLYCNAKNLSKRTIGSYEQSLRLFAQFLKEKYGIEEVSKVNTGHIRQYLDYLGKRGKYTVIIDETKKEINNPENRQDFGQPLSTTTKANYLRNLKVFFNWLYGEGEIPKNPVAKIEQIKPQRKVKKPLSEQDLKRIANCFVKSTFTGYRNYVIFKFLLDTGARIQETLSLTHNDIDLKFRVVTLRNTKNKQERKVYLSPKMLQEMKNWLKYKERYVSSDLIFPTKRGTPLTVHSYEKQLRDAGKLVGIDISPHMLRNQFARYYILNGGNFPMLSKLLGHSDVKVTMDAYMDLLDEDIKKDYMQHSPLNHFDL